MKNIPYDLERVIVLLKTTGWIPIEKEISCDNKTYIVNFEKTGSAKIYIKYKDFWDAKNIIKQKT